MLSPFATPAAPCPYASSSDWSERLTLMPSEPSITVHSRSSKLRSPCTTKGSASAISRAACALGARTIVRPSPRIWPSAAASGPDANSTPFFSNPIMYSRCRGKLRDLFGSRAAFGQNDVELLAKHALGELADALLRHGILLGPKAPCRGVRWRLSRLRA